MKPIATIYIPFSEAHKDIVHRAFTSAVNQTLKCEIVIGLSPNTPAKLRNQAVNAKTPFVSWLDADDYLEPNFVEECVKRYQTGTYVYTSWYEGERIMCPRECNPYLAHDFGDGRGRIGGYHLVTTLYPTALFQALGDFDETLKGMEDTDFYMRSQRAGVCGILCDKPLLHYNYDGYRSKEFMKLPDYEDLRRWVIERNGGNEAMAGCCGVSAGSNQANLTGQQPGDIAVQTLYAPSTQVGRATGRWYPRPLFMGQTIMVAPEDAAVMTELFKPIKQLSELAPTREMVLRESGLV